MSLSRVCRVLPAATRSLRNTRTLATIAAANPTQQQQQQQQQGQQGQQGQQEQSVSSSEVVRRDDRSGSMRRHRGDVFSELERDMNQMMGSFMSPFSSLSAWSPFRGVSPFDWNMSGRRRGLMDFDQLLNRAVNINLEEKDTEYVMTVQAPGLKKEELDINVDDGMLTISGSHEERHEGRKGTKSSHVSFQRSMSLPEDINQDGIKAEYDDKGNLCRVHLPKVPETERKQRGKIPIESTHESTHES